MRRKWILAAGLGLLLVGLLMSPDGRALSGAEARGVVGGDVCFNNSSCNVGASTCYLSNFYGGQLNPCPNPVGGICTTCENDAFEVPGCTGGATGWKCHYAGTVHCGCMLGGVCNGTTCEDRYGCGGECADYNDCEAKLGTCPW
jgi:hypothetical protein